MRQIVLDTETTGLEVEDGHRVIEIGCVELIDRRHTGTTYHQYIRPDRKIDAAALQVHGITAEFLSSQPAFDEIVAEFLEFVGDAELVIHNAEFDVTFLDYELALIDRPLGVIGDYCKVLDTLAIARRMHPGQRNNLDALCKRHGVPTIGRELHGALLDARLLSEVYLAMTGGQVMLSLAVEDDASQAAALQHIDRAGLELPVVRCTELEKEAHEQVLSRIEGACDTTSVWRRLESS
ncbi:MAG: DNA polymerase III subunit epsilon [Gammaproteobacteria bacterium]|nr:DNA polymerase III subunit epsilon [Gammaproteobacteria bacterium]NNM20068.1 DNA polymerase III subunit epsilon [Gammaproteobacteria bacterium]